MELGFHSRHAVTTGRHRQGSQLRPLDRAAASGSLPTSERAAPTPERAPPPAAPVLAAAAPAPGPTVARVALPAAAAPPSMPTAPPLPRGANATPHPTDEGARAPDAPLGMAWVPARVVEWRGERHFVAGFFLDVPPVTHAPYVAYTRQARSGRRRFTPPSSWRGGGPPTELVRHPVTGVTCQDASAYAAWAGKRLPTPLEWLSAALATADGAAFPWGAGCAAGRCECPFRSATGTSPVDADRAHHSGDGVRDLYGNVWEWTAHRGPLRALAPDHHHVLGGSWADACPADKGDVPLKELAAMTAAPTVGFRCAVDAGAAKP